MVDGKWIEDLSSSTRTVDAAKRILKIRLTVVRNSLPAAVERPYEDVEHIHQLRVATRRASAALRIFAACLPSKFSQAAKKSLRRLRRAAGDARDWDVFILSLDHAQPLQTDSGRHAGDFLRGYALIQRTNAQAHLQDIAKHEQQRFDEVCRILPQTVEEKDLCDSTRFCDVAAKQMQLLGTAFEGALSSNPTDPPALHQLRILAKRIRYAMELFAPCFPPAFKDQLYPAVEQLQEILGQMQDAVVGIERLTLLRSEIQRFMPAYWPRVRPGITGLISGLRRKIPTARRQFQAWRSRWERLTRECPLA